MNGRKWKGRPQRVSYCAWKGCALSVPMSIAFCPAHLRDALRELSARGLLRDPAEVVPVERRPKWRTYEEG